MLNYDRLLDVHIFKMRLYTFTLQIIGDALPLVLAGHPHDVECMCTDGVLLVSSCLAGIIRVWDPSTGECVASINRRR